MPLGGEALLEASEERRRLGPCSLSLTSLINGLRIVALLLITLVALVLTLHPPGAGSSQDFDFLVLDQDWPQSQCSLERRFLDGKWFGCARPERNRSTDWVVFGLWAGREDGHRLDGCQQRLGGPGMEPEGLSWLWQRLGQEWILAWSRLGREASLTSLWERFGSCLHSQPLFANALTYFDQGLRLGERYNARGLLAWAGLTPGEVSGSRGRPAHYQLASVKAALREGLGPLRFFLYCLPNPSDALSIPFLASLRLCLHKHSLQPMDCPEAVEELEWMPRPRAWRPCDELAYTYRRDGVEQKTNESHRLILYPALFPSHHTRANNQRMGS